MRQRKVGSVARVVACLLRQYIPKTKRRRGQAITELAVVLPLLAVLLVGVVDLGRIYYQSIALHEATQAGALAALDSSRYPDCSNATNTVITAIQRAPQGITIPSGDIKLGPTGGSYGTPGAEWQGANCWKPSQHFTIEVRHDFNFISPYLNIGTNRVLTLKSNIDAKRNP